MFFISNVFLSNSTFAQMAPPKPTPCTGRTTRSVSLTSNMGREVACPRVANFLYRSFALSKAVVEIIPLVVLSSLKIIRSWMLVVSVKVGEANNAISLIVSGKSVVVWITSFAASFFCSVCFGFSLQFHPKTTMIIKSIFIFFIFMFYLKSSKFSKSYFFEGNAKA